MVQDNRELVEKPKKKKVLELRISICSCIIHNTYKNSSKMILEYKNNNINLRAKYIEKAWFFLVGYKILLS